MARTRFEALQECSATIVGRPGNDKTVLNTVSALLLTVGLLAFAATLILQVVRRRRLAVREKNTTTPRRVH